ncbi:unnamed protein product, partial [marine sediment metagenome]
MNPERADLKPGGVNLRSFLLNAKFRLDHRAFDLAAQEKSVGNEQERGRA